MSIVKTKLSKKIFNKEIKIKLFQEQNQRDGRNETVDCENIYSPLKLAAFNTDCNRVKPKG